MCDNKLITMLFPEESSFGMAMIECLLKEESDGLSFKQILKKMRIHEDSVESEEISLWIKTLSAEGILLTRFRRPENIYCVNPKFKKELEEHGD